MRAAIKVAAILGAIAAIMAALGAPLYVGQNSLLIHMDEVETRHEIRDRENHAEVKEWIEDLNENVTGKLEEHEGQIREVAFRVDNIVSAHPARAAPRPAASLAPPSAHTIPQSTPAAPQTPQQRPIDHSSPPRAAGEILLIRERTESGDIADRRIASRDFFERLREMTEGGSYSWKSELHEVTLNGRTVRCTLFRRTQSQEAPSLLTCQ